jgi:P pilus assembly chaperone PapD
MRGIIPLMLIILTVLFPVISQGLQVLTPSDKGIEVNQTDPSRITLKNEQQFPIVVKIDISDGCKEKIKVFPRIFEIPPESSQIVKILAKEKQSDCKVLFTWEDKKEDSGKANTVNARFIMSLPIR